MSVADELESRFCAATTHMMSHFRPLFNRLRRDDGMTLVELLIVMALLLIVIGALSDGFVSTTRAEVDQTNRANDQQTARQALDQMRRDIHCATTPDPPTAISGGYELILNEPSDGCPGVTVTAGASAVVWCTQFVSTGRYRLYRSVPPPGSTDQCPQDSTFEVDYVTQANIWTPWCTTSVIGETPTVPVDLTVNRDWLTQPDRTYELKDAIALRNAPPYTDTTCDTNT